MKFNSVALTLATAGSMVAAQHQHGHRHHHKREVVTVDGPTVVRYELDGQIISAEDVCQGITDGDLAWADGKPAADPCQTSTSTQQYTPTVAPAKFIETSSSTTTTTTTTTTTSTTTVSVPTTTSTKPAATSSASSPAATGLDAAFPDGEIDCGTFPSDYGAVPLDYLGLGGWSGIQYVTIVGQLVSEIVTAITGDSCTEGAMCSYACPPGYQKAHWPSAQGATGQSVGGLRCKGGKLYKTNPDLSDTLCIQGVGGVKVKNTLSQHVAVCRTDYPGTESETVPVSLAAGAEDELTCPNGATYYQWQGKTTSAQYYVNPAGVSQEDGCQWGDGSKPIGNFAPINLGVGENNGKWLSIFQNSPTTNEKLDFNIKIKGDNLSGSCKYENGVFVSDTGSNDSGCTVQVMSGEATYVFY